MAGLPSAASTLAFQAYAGSGVFAFDSPGATVASALDGVAGGDSIELRGSSVSNVAFGTNSIKIATNLGTMTFTNVGYAPGFAVTGYSATVDSQTGLEKVTFTGEPSTDFQRGVSSKVGIYSVYLWSALANWTNGAFRAPAVWSTSISTSRRTRAATPTSPI